MRARLAPLAAGVGWLSGLGGAAWWLTRLGSGRLAPPPLRRPGSWFGWAQAAGPVDATFAVVRLACLAGVGYLAAVVLVGLAARLSGLRPLLRLSEAMSGGLARRLVHGTLGLGVTAGALGTAGAALCPAASVGAAVASAAAPTRPPTLRSATSPDAVTTPAGAPAHPITMRTAAATDRPTMRTAGSAEALTMRAGEPAGTLTMRAGEPAGTLTMRAGEPAATPAAATPAPASAPAAPPSERVLAPGDHLWSIAEDQVRSRSGAAATDEEITSYWRKLVQLNRDQLADPDNPDLVFAGQVIRLPPL